jgi:hypothetical protein
VPFGFLIGSSPLTNRQKVSLYYVLDFTWGADSRISDVLDEFLPKTCFGYLGSMDRWILWRSNDVRNGLALFSTSKPVGDCTGTFVEDRGSHVKIDFRTQ